MVFPSWRLLPLQSVNANLLSQVTNVTIILGYENSEFAIDEPVKATVVTLEGLAALRVLRLGAIKSRRAFAKKKVPGRVR